MRRLGIMGGTFDPIHEGHLACARMAREACDLDEVIFMVAGTPNFKQGQELAPSSDRLEMVRLAIEGEDGFSVSDAEVRRGGVTYTADTLAVLKAEGPQDELFFILGADSLMSLMDWKDAQAIASSAQVVCVSRPGFPVDEGLLLRLDGQGFSVRLVEAELPDISSSMVRDQVAQGRTVAALVPDAVAAHIEERGLYGGGRS